MHCPVRLRNPLMIEAIAISTAIVALAEIGDKTQLLAIVLAARFKRPWPIIGGILVATLANHFLAALAGSAAAGWFDGPAFRYAVAIGFLAMAAWTLVPDKLDDDEAPAPARFGAFLTTVAAFFLVEMGDKTQIATIALGARFHDALAVTIGTTLGMMLANVPAVLLGGELVKRVPLQTVRIVAALLFAALGIWLLLATAGVV
jgi:Ca2+/H+ antiporter, TMEM165/GDT1 family